MPLLVVEDRAWDAPRVAVVAGNDGVNASHVALARDALLVGHDEVLLLPLGDAGLPEQGGPRLLVGGPHDTYVPDVASGRGFGGRFSGVQGCQRRK